MSTEILSLTEKKVPSVIGLSSKSELVVGNAARELGLQGRTNTYHFKTQLGKPQDDQQYEARVGRAGQRLAGKPRPYWVRNPVDKSTKSFSPLEATRFFLGKLLPEGNASQKLIVGEPTLDETWRENYRTNIRSVLSGLGYEDPLFFPEPFAVYQYYRHIDKRIGNSDCQQTVLVIDFGGGTFDCCVIRTAQSGELARSGANSRPLGTQSCVIAGEQIDIALLEVAKDRSRKQGVVFKDDPIDRARQSAQSLWLTENVKIKLSEAVSALKPGSADLSRIQEKLSLPAGSFHISEPIEVLISGEDLKEVVTRLWRRHWGENVLKCHRESGKKIGEEIQRYDVVLLAGGSAHLPFIAELIKTTLPNELQDAKVITGGYAGAAVAQGIAVECREQSDRRPDLVHDRLVSCLINNLYIRIGRSKKERDAPKVRHGGAHGNNQDGLVYESPGILEDDTIRCQLEHRYQPRGTLHYWFHGTRKGDEDALNVSSTSVRLPSDKAADKKIGLELNIESDGTITPIFIFKWHGKGAERVTGQPFNLGTERIVGNTFLGVDFGTCNSYIAKFIDAGKHTDYAAYPNYEVTRDTSARLLALDDQCRALRETGVLSASALLDHAMQNRLGFIFHSNKIEGNRLSRGQTEGTLKSSKSVAASKDQKEALNLRDAYEWMLKNHESIIEQFASFTREVNRKLLRDLEKTPGSYRQEDVTISGMGYQPPSWGDVSDYMSQLNSEVRNSFGKTSGLELAVRAHTKLVAIHPFVDGNGRTARLAAAAVLLAHGLPVLVLNCDDKERYLDSLKKSNDGSLDGLLSLFIELMQEIVAGFEATSGSLLTPEREPRVSNIAGPAGVPADSAERREEEAREWISRRPESDPSARLKTILKGKGKVRRDAQEVTYPAWSSAFEMFRKELAACAEELDRLEEFRDAGYDLKFTEFDVVNQERYEAFWTRRDVSRTWFFSVEISNAMEGECYGVMFQFGRSTKELRAIASAPAPVSCSLAIGGQVTGNWLPLRDEPIRLREIGYADGELIFMDYDGSRIGDGLRDIFNELIADLLGS